MNNVKVRKKVINQIVHEIWLTVNKKVKKSIYYNVWSEIYISVNVFEEKVLNKTSRSLDNDFF